MHISWKFWCVDFLGVMPLYYLFCVSNALIQSCQVIRESEVCDLGHFSFYFNHFTKNFWCEIYFYESEKVSLSFHFALMVVERYMLFMKKEKWFYANYNFFVYLFFFFSLLLWIYSGTNYSGSHWQLVWSYSWPSSSVALTL